MKSEYITSLILAAVIGYLIYVIMAPFFTPVFWAGVLAILCYPQYQWLLRRVTSNANLAALIACVVISLFLIVPAALMGTVLVDEFTGLFHWAEGYIKDVPLPADGGRSLMPSFVERLIGPYVDLSRLDLHAAFARTIKEISSHAASGIQGFIKNFAQFFFNLALMFCTLFFLLKEGERVLGMIKDLIPLTDRDKDHIIETLRVVISATINGGVLIGALQGFLGGIAFLFLGLPSPILWGFVMFILSFIPGIGTAMVWFPAAVYLLITGSYVKGALLMVWGVLVVGLADNILRPYIISGKTNLHPMLLFFSVLGAVNAFGLIGVVAGPIILSVAIAVLTIYRESVKKIEWTG